MIYELTFNKVQMISSLYIHNKYTYTKLMYTKIKPLM